MPSATSLDGARSITLRKRAFASSTSPRCCASTPSRNSPRLAAILSFDFAIFSKTFAASTYIFCWRKHSPMRNCASTASAVVGKRLSSEVHSERERS